MASTNSIFQEPWWLDAVAPARWSSVEVESGGAIVGRMPYISVTRFGLRALTMPPLTQTLGPWLASEEGKYAQRLTREKRLMTRLIEQLPKFDYFAQNFHHSIVNWLPFYWNGFEQTTRYTYTIDDLTDLDRVWAGFQDKARTDIRKAERQLEVKEGKDIALLTNLTAKTYERQGTRVPYSTGVLERLDQACAERNASKMWFAEDGNGRIHAALYLVWDQRCAYYLIGGADPELRSSGASSLLMWHSIRFAATVTERFDFEGSMMEPVERFVRGFGAVQTPYFRITKKSRRTKLLFALRDAALAVRSEK